MLFIEILEALSKEGTMLFSLDKYSSNILTKPGLLSHSLQGEYFNIKKQVIRLGDEIL